MNHFDIIVIGAGSGGLTVAIGLANTGKKVALVEKGHIGGDCTNFGCVPSKALLHFAKQGTDIQIALEKTRATRQIIRDEETEEKLEKYGLKFFKGAASFIDKNTISLDKKIQLSAKYIVISTGSHGRTIAIDGVPEENILTNTSIFEQKDLKNLVIIGGGYIGCELASAFTRLGVKVTIIQRNKYLLPREEEETSEHILNYLQGQGVTVITNTTVTSGTENTLELTNKNTQEKSPISYEKVLFAIGRIPNTEKLGLENIGIETEKGGIPVNNYNQTKHKHIFAIGDCVAGNPQFTHWANHEGRGVVKTILSKNILKTNRKKAILPSVIYTPVEIARVGKTKEEILKKYGKDDFYTQKVDFTLNDRSKLTEDTTGYIVIHFKRLSGKILGATIVGKHAGEMIQVVNLSMQENISAYKLSKNIFPYPVKGEVIKKAADTFVIRTLGNIKGEILFFLKENILQILTGIIWAAIIGIFIYVKNTYNLSIETLAFNMYSFIKEQAFWGPVIYMFLYTIRPIILFPATIMTFMSGVLFGPILGIIYTLIGENFSASFAYLLGKIFGKKILKGQDEGGLIHRIKDGANKDPFMSILMTRLLFFPFDLVNYISGILHIKFPQFFLATLIGIIPGASIFVIAGAAFYGKEITSFGEMISQVDTKLLLLAGILFVITIVIAKILKRKQK